MFCLDGTYGIYGLFSLDNQDSKKEGLKKRLSVNRGYNISSKLVFLFYQIFWFVKLCFLGLSNKIYFFSKSHMFGIIDKMYKSVKYGGVGGGV